MLRRTVVVGTTLACLVVIDLVVRRVDESLAKYDRRMDPQAYYRKPAALGNRPMPNIVLMGSSRVSYGLVPAVIETETGLDVYNFGVSNAAPAEWQALARGAFDRDRPEVVVLGVNADAFDADGEPLRAASFLFSASDMIESLWTDGYSANVASEYGLRLLGDLWRLYQRQHELKLWAHERLAVVLPTYAQSAREAREYIGRPCADDGYEHPWQRGKIRRYAMLPIDDEINTNHILDIPRFAEDAVAFARFEALLATFQEQDIGVVVAYLPNSVRVEEHWRNTEVLFVSQIADICRRRDVPFIPCDQDAVPRTDWDYLDDVHVGLPLAGRISRRIGRRLAEAGYRAATGYRAETGYRVEVDDRAETAVPLAGANFEQ